MVSGQPGSNFLLLDANTLVNAVFLSKSWSRRALDSAISRQMTLLVSNVVLDEAQKIIREAIAGQLVQTDPWVLVEEYCASMAVAKVYCGRHSPICSVEPHDHHMELAVRQTNARVISNDIGLVSSLRALGLPACYPLELVAEGNHGALDRFFFGERPTPATGSFFFRGNPAGSCEIITWPRFHVSYDHILGNWTVTANGEEVLKAPYPYVHGSEHVLGLSWDTAKIKLRLGGVEHPATETLNAPLDVDFNQADELCKQFNGTVFLATMDDRLLGKETFKKALEDPPYASPNPYDSDRVRPVIRACAVSS